MKRIANFFLKVNIVHGNCFELDARTTENGYCRIWNNGRNVQAHRVSYELFRGEIPEGVFVCHKCDNKRCVNPDHLFLGTNRDNQLDAVRKGRIACGGKVPNSKLTVQAVRLIRQQFLDGWGLRSIAKRFGIGRTTVKRIVTRETWKHIQ